MDSGGTSRSSGDLVAAARHAASAAPRCVSTAAPAPWLVGRRRDAGANAVVAVAAAPGSCSLPDRGACRSAHRQGAADRGHRADGAFHRQWLDGGGQLGCAAGGDRRCPAHGEQPGTRGRHCSNGRRAGREFDGCRQGGADCTGVNAGAVAARPRARRGRNHEGEVRCKAGSTLAKRRDRGWNSRRNRQHAGRRRFTEDLCRRRRQGTAGSVAAVKRSARFRRRHPARQCRRRTQWRGRGAGQP